MLRRALAACLSLILSTSLALAQTVPLQAGPWAPGHAPAYTGGGFGQPLMRDSGSAAGGGPGLGLNELLLQQATPGTGPLGTNLCTYDGPTTAPYHFICLGAGAQGGGTLAFGAGGGAPQTPFFLNINGVQYPFPSFFVLPGTLNLRTFGGVDDDVTDNAKAFANVIGAAAAAGGGTVVVPATQACFKIGSTVSLVASHVHIVGEPGACLDVGFAQGAGIQIGNGGDGSTAKPQTVDSSVSRLVIKNSVLHSAGANIQVYGALNALVENNLCTGGNAFQCVADDLSTGTRILNQYVKGEGQAGIAIGCNYGQSTDPFVSGGDTNFQHRAAHEWCNVSGLIIKNVNTDFNLHAVWAHPAAGQEIGAVYSSSNFFDYSTLQGVFIDGSGGGTIIENVFDPTTWIATCGLSIPSNFTAGLTQPFQDNGAAACFDLNATSQTLDNRWFMHEFNSGGDGVYFHGTGAVGNDFGGFVSQNGQVAGAAFHGFHVSAGLSHWSWNGRSGSPTGLGGAVKQGYSVVIDPGASDYYSVSGDLTGSSIGPLYDMGTGTHKTFDGMLPALPWQTFIPSVTASNGTLTNASGTMQYAVKGTTVSFNLSVNITTNGTGSGSLVTSFPIPPNNGIAVTLVGRNAGSGAPVYGVINPFATTMNIVTATNGYPGADATSLSITGSYQIAP